MADPVAVLAARLRATGHLPLSAADPDRWGELDQRLRRTGRRLVDVRTPDAPPAVVAGWDQGEGPASSDDVVLPERSPMPLRVFGAALRACWADPTDPPWPGRTVTTEQVLAAVAPNDGAARQAKGFIASLVAAGLLDQPHDGALRLGPAVAAWNDTTVATWRRVHDKLSATEEHDRGC